MLQRRAALAVILALSLALAACGGSGDEATGDRAAEPTMSPQAASATPQAEPTPAENAAG